MYHEARRNEKKIKTMMVDYKKRAERRKDFYEKIRRDPIEFLQVHGSRMKIHMDSNITTNAENSLVPWRGDTSNMIDRFDVRAHLDTIPPPVKHTPNTDDSRLNYERWRSLIQNDFLGNPDDRVLQMIELEERFGESERSDMYREQKDLKRKLAASKSAIGFNYNDTNGPQASSSNGQNDNSSDSDSDFEKTEIEIDLKTLSSDQLLKVNEIAHKFGVKGDSFAKFMDEDRMESQRLKAARELEQEKSMFSGKKARRERRSYKQKKQLIMRTNVLPVETSEVKNSDESSSSESEPEVKPKTEFITSFGGSSDDDNEPDSPKAKSVSKKPKVKQKMSLAKSQTIKKELETIGPQLPEPSMVEFKPKSELRPFIAKMKEIRKRELPKVRSRSRSRSKDRKRSSRRSRSRDHRSSRDIRRSKSRERSRRHRSRSKSRERRKRSRSRTRDRRKRSRSRSRERRRRSRSRSRDRHRDRRSRSRDRIRRRRRSPSVDEFGRAIDKRREISPEPVTKVEPVIKKEPVIPKVEATFDTIATNDTIPQVVPQPPPPRKSYYRPELAEKGSDSDSDHGLKKPKIEEAVKSSVGVESSASNRVTNKSGWDKHRQLLKRTRAQIENQFKRDKETQKMRIKDEESRNGSSSRSGGWSSGSSSSSSP